MDPLLPEQLEALRQDIQARGILVPVEVDERGNILDGHHRDEIAKELGITYKTITRRLGTDSAKWEHAIKLNLCRRHLEPYQWGTAFKRLLEAKGVSTGQGSRNDLNGTSAKVAEVAKSVGVPYRTARRRLKQAEMFQSLPKQLKEQVQHGCTVNRAYKDHQRELARSETKTCRLVSPSVRVITGTKAPTEPVDLVLTDPPYNDMQAFSRLGKLAAEILKPQGSLITYTGSYYLPEVIRRLEEHLKYYWTLAVIHSGPSNRIHPRKIQNAWKPLLWFTRSGKRFGGDIRDVIQGVQDKQHHEWQQGLPEARYIIRYLTPEGGMVLDPFCGSGTTLAAALLEARRAIGVEKNPQTARMARARLRKLIA